MLNLYIPKSIPKLKLSQLDKDIFKLSQSSLCNYAMTPLIGAIDTYWISRLHNPSIIAGQGNADRLFNSIFSISSIAPSIITPIISKYHSINDTPAKLVKELQNDLRDLKYWVGEDCKEYLFEYLTSHM